MNNSLQPSETAGVPESPASRTAPVLSIVCVYNDVAVRQQCLDASISAYEGSSTIEYLPVDNTRHDFASAGAALNHGTSLATGDVVVLVHQDVHLHSIDRLVEAAGHLGSDWTVLGANGVSTTGESTGHLRDRVELIGKPAPRPRQVETLDEVLFMVRRDQLLAEPLTEHPDLAWHAYAVEYCLRVAAAGGRVGAVDTAITHHSLTINLARLDVAHASVGEKFPHALPIHTTCGTIGSPTSRLRKLPVLRDHRWRLRWLQQSVAAAGIQRRHRVGAVLGDIRHTVDDIPFDASAPLFVLNVDAAGDFGRGSSGTFTGTRLGKPVRLSVEVDAVSVLATIDDLPSRSWVLVTGLGHDQLGELLPTLPDDRSWTVGVQPSGPWLLGAAPGCGVPDSWTTGRSVPLRVPGLVRAR